MERAHNQERIVTMHRMLFEMARGNFSNRIPLSSFDDELETLVVLINMVAEEMKESIFQVGYVNTHRAHQFIEKSTFILDGSFIIKSFTSEITRFLGYSESELIDLSLANIISAISFKGLQKVLLDNIPQSTTIILDFIPKKHLPISVSCSIGKLINCSGIILNLVTPVYQYSYNNLAYGEENEKQIKSRSRKTDAHLIQKLYDYILAHLEEPLPSLRTLSYEFGTNEFKLKDGFRYFFKTSIYQFYNDERLKRAYFMIENTTIPLKKISVMNGFNNYPNFSKSFKKRFGFSPYELKRNEINFATQSED